MRGCARSRVWWLLLILLLLAPQVVLAVPRATSEALHAPQSDVAGRADTVWIDGGQPWPQVGRVPGRDQSAPTHAHDGGPGEGTVANTTVLGSIEEPSINWKLHPDDWNEIDSLGATIADLWSNVDPLDDDERERCGEGELFALWVAGGAESGDADLIIAAAGQGRIAWSWNLGAGSLAKAAPLVVDLGNDGTQEVILVHDTDGDLTVQAFRPRLTCQGGDWSTTSSAGDELWTWTDESLHLGASGPYSDVLSGGHLVVAQPLLADIDLDGDAELVIAANDDENEVPVVVALPLSDSIPSTTLYQRTLDSGTIPSDPAWVQLDDSTSAVLLTTVNEDNGRVYAWRLDGTSGSVTWDAIPLQTLRTSNDVPHIRLPGPVLAQLDGDALPEVLLTLPIDPDDDGPRGAEVRAWELTDASELWSLEIGNGFLDAPPVPADTDGDGEHDRICWVGWTAANLGWTRAGHAGCHDVGDGSPSQAFSRQLDRDGGTLNDAIAVAAPIVLDLDGEFKQELVVTYGRKVWALDGETGTTIDVSDGWTGGLALGRRTWAAPAAADVDRDGWLDVLVGDILLSHSQADVAGAPDGSAIVMTPAHPDPGKTVNITGQVWNIGTAAADEDVHVVLEVDGVEVGRTVFTELDPRRPSGEGDSGLFDVQWVATAGMHEVVMRIDPDGNVTQARRDNDIVRRPISVVEPWAARIDFDERPMRLDNGSSRVLQPIITATGRLAGPWNLSFDASGMPDRWTVAADEPDGLLGIQLAPGSEAWRPRLIVSVPSDAIGTDSGVLRLVLRPSDGAIPVVVESTLTVEVNRSRGLSLLGPAGHANATGYGLPGEEASAWLRLENLGNVPEDASWRWSSSTWPSQPSLHAAGQEVQVLRLKPFAALELEARMAVPSSAALGEAVTVTLQISVMSDSDDLPPRSVVLTFTANGVRTDPPHVRTRPLDAVTWEVRWEVRGRLPQSADSLSWDLADDGGVPAGWSMSGGDELVVAGSQLRLKGTPGGIAEGMFTLRLPPDAPPAHHLWTVEAAGHTGRMLVISLRLTQVHRANLSVTIPESQPHRVTGGEAELIMLQLENPGNARDAYVLEAVFVPGTMSSDPGIVAKLLGQFWLERGVVAHVPIYLTLPVGTPALVDLEVRLTMRALAETGVSSSESVILQARQQHRWNASAATALTLQPREVTPWPVQLRNDGNLLDEVTLVPRFSATLIGNDTATGWTAASVQEVDIGVGATRTIALELMPPQGAWAGSSAQLEVDLLSEGLVIDTLHVALTIGLEWGWQVRITAPDLDVPHAGAELSLELVNLGNAEATPRVSPRIEVGGPEWNLSGEMWGDAPLEPGQRAALALTVRPPPDALAGTVGVIELIASNNASISEGRTRVTVPVRVVGVPDFTSHLLGDWIVAAEGGRIPIWVESTGRAVETAMVEVAGLPIGWNVSGSDTLVLAPGAAAAADLRLVPVDGWDGTGFGVTVRVQGAEGRTEEHTVQIAQGSVAWEGSPLLTGVQRDEVRLEFRGLSPSSVSTDAGGPARLKGGTWWWTLPQGERAVTVTVDGTHQLDAWLRADASVGRTADCDLKTDDPANLSACRIWTGAAALTWSLLVSDEAGRLVGWSSGHIGAGEGGWANLSVPEWSPGRGTGRLTVELRSADGVVIDQVSAGWTRRTGGWNLGIRSLELIERSDGFALEVFTVRDGADIVDAGACEWLVEGGGWSRRHALGPVATRPPNLALPSELRSGEEVTVRIDCAAPWDEDDVAEDDVASIILSQQVEGVRVATWPDWSVGLIAFVAALAALLGLRVLMRPGDPEEQEDEGASARRRRGADRSRTVERPARQDAEQRRKASLAGDSPGAAEGASEAPEDGDEDDVAQEDPEEASSADDDEVVDVTPEARTPGRTRRPHPMELKDEADLPAWQRRALQRLRAAEGAEEHEAATDDAADVLDELRQRRSAAQGGPSVADDAPTDAVEDRLDALLRRRGPGGDD